MGKTLKDDQPRIYFDCTKCPAYCCAVYDRVQVTKRDINRLARHFSLTVEAATRRFTKSWKDERVLRRKRDPLFGQACQFLNPETRGCTIYHARPSVCRTYPDRPRCSYYDLIQFERKQQADENVLPLVQITFRDVKPKRVARPQGSEQVWEWTPER